MLRIIALVALCIGAYVLSLRFDLITMVGESMPYLKGYEWLSLLGTYTLLVAGVVCGGNREVINNKVDLSALKAEDIEAINEKLSELRLANTPELAKRLQTNIAEIRSTFMSIKEVSKMDLGVPDLETKLRWLSKLDPEDISSKAQDLASTIEAIKGLDVSSLNGFNVVRVSSLTNELADMFSNTLGDVDFGSLKENTEQLVEVLEAAKALKLN